MKKAGKWSSRPVGQNFHLRHLLVQLPEVKPSYLGTQVCAQSFKFPFLPVRNNLHFSS